MKVLNLLFIFLISGCVFGHTEYSKKTLEYSKLNFIGLPSILGFGVTGSSTPISETLSVTNKHVAYPLFKKVTKASKNCDAVVISQNNHGETFRQWAPIRIGEEITVYGYSGITLMPLTSKGVVKKFTINDDCTTVLTTAGGVSGMSGGAVVNKKGQLVGILSAVEFKSGMTVIIPYQSLYDIFPISIRDSAERWLNVQRTN